MKILIFGIVASGKTTLAKKLSAKLKIPYYEEDCIAWGHKNDRYKKTPEEQLKIIQEIDNNESWIIEGTYRESQKCLFDLADKIIFLDTPLYIRKYRIISRFIRQQLHLEKCHYKSDFYMLRLMFKWTKDFENNRSFYDSFLKNFENKLIRVTSQKELYEIL